MPVFTATIAAAPHRQGTVKLHDTAKRFSLLMSSDAVSFPVH